MARRLALLIGNAEFEELDNFPNLPTPANDVNDFAQLLMEQGEFEIVEQLIDKDTDVLRKSIENFYRGTKSGDLTLFYYSGHGFRNEDGALCLVACDTQLNHPLSTSIQESFIRDAMRFGRSQHRVIILDCCFSGTFNVGSKTGVETLLFDKLQGETTAILSSSSRVQLSFVEKGRNSLFTKFLLEGIKTERADSNRDGQITINELFAYSESRVRESRPEQTPTLKLHERMDQVVIAKTTLSNETSASSVQPVHELLEKALANSNLLNTYELDQVAAQSTNPQLKLTNDEQKLILLSSMAQERGIPAWLHLNEPEMLLFLRMARLDSAYDVTLRLKVTGHLGRLEDEETFSALQQEATSVSKVKQKETTSGLAHFIYHSQQKRPLPLHLSFPVEIKLAALRRRDYRGYITTLSATAGRYAGLSALITGFDKCSGFLVKQTLGIKNGHSIRAGVSRFNSFYTFDHRQFRLDTRYHPRSHPCLLKQPNLSAKRRCATLATFGSRCHDFFRQLCFPDSFWFPRKGIF